MSNENTLIHNGETFIATPIADVYGMAPCYGCHFYNSDLYHILQCPSLPPCSGYLRSDHKHIIWIKKND